MLNKVILVGNLGSEAETRQVGDSTVAKFNVATTERYKDKTGQVKEETEWHRCEYWNAGNVAMYLHKGTTVCIVGSIRTDAWTDSNGQKREDKKIKVTELKLVGKKENPPYPSAGTPQAPQYPQQGYAPQGFPQAQSQGFPQAQQAFPQQQAAPAPQFAPQAPQFPQQAQFAMPVAGNDLPDSF